MLQLCEYNWPQLSAPASHKLVWWHSFDALLSVQAEQRLQHGNFTQGAANLQNYQT